MSIDLTLPVRRAILRALKSDAGVTALVAASSIHPQTPLKTPVWPFIKYGAPSGLPFGAACVSGNEIIGAVHSFAKQRKNGNQVLETAEDHASRIGAAVVACLGRTRLALEGGQSARIRVTDWQLLQDGSEADAYHHVTAFGVRVLS
jgi:nucleotide-binding universal stress UspA family protein